MNATGWQKALALLEPLEPQLDAALAAGDARTALQLAFDGATEAVRLVSEPASGRPAVHGVYVELTPLPLVTYEDGTLRENGAYVTLAYQRWDVAEEQAERLAGDLLAREREISTGWAVDSS